MQKTLFLNVKQLLKIGAYFNVEGAVQQPALNKFFIGYRQSVAIYHYDVLIEYFLLIRIFIFNVIRKKGSLLFYDDSKRFEKVMSFYAPVLNQQVLLGRWVPGTFTNYHRLQYNRLAADVRLTQMPDLIFFFNMFDNDVLLKEAFDLNIPVLSIIDAKTKFLFYYTYVLPGNKQSYKFVIFIFYLISYYLFKYNKMIYNKTKQGNARKKLRHEVVNRYYATLVRGAKYRRFYRKAFFQQDKRLNRSTWIWRFLGRYGL